MTDTTVPIVVAANILNTSITGVGVVVFGVHTGLDYATLIAGVLGGATALSYLEPSTLIRRGFEVITASLLAGYSSPTIADIASNALKKFGVISEHVTAPQGMQLILAFIVGYMAHGVILPGLRKIGEFMVRRHSSG